MKYVLILWSAFMNSPDHQNSGALLAIHFEDERACVVALAKVKAGAKYVNGFCTPEALTEKGYPK